MELPNNHNQRKFGGFSIGGLDFWDAPHNGAVLNQEGRMCERLQSGVKRKMASDKQNLQDAFLNHVRKNKVPLTVFLVNGVKLQGVITWFDNFCVLLRRDGHSQLVYKHAISTVMPGGPVSLFEGEQDDE